MRFEARHRYFKRLALQLGNFLQCYHQLSDTLEGEEVDIGPGHTILSEAVEGLSSSHSTELFRYSVQDFKKYMRARKIITPPHYLQKVAL